MAEGDVCRDKKHLFRGCRRASQVVLQVVIHSQGLCWISELKSISKSEEFHQHLHWQQSVRLGSVRGAVSWPRGHEGRPSERETGSSTPPAHCVGDRETRAALDAQMTTLYHLSTQIESAENFLPPHCTKLRYSF